MILFLLLPLYLSAVEKPKTVHIIVALCDNEHQGIVPVPKNIGNGDKPNSNLYWGCSEGVKTIFTSSKDWKLLSINVSRRNGIRSCSA
jgi:hypothetical protein